MDILKLVYAFFNTPGIGGAIVLIVFLGAMTLYYFLARWIIQGGKKDRR